MNNQSYLPILKLTRGISSDHPQTIESVHYGAIAVVDALGNLLASYGDPYTLTYLRSSAKPFQALPFFERGGDKFYDLNLKEIALICASHSGTDEHVEIARSIQSKAGINENQLLCGIHPPMHEPTAELLRQHGVPLTPNRHNCSGKHSGMLAFAQMENLPLDSYLENDHPIQVMIVQTLAEMCDLPVAEIMLGTDGCSAPNFAMPLYNAALGYARLCDPENGKVQPAARAHACTLITKAMTTHPFMVAGPQRLDTLLMQTTQGRILSKAGAEGYRGMGLLVDNGKADSIGIGIALKISDGDLQGRANPAVSLEVLKQLSAITEAELKNLNMFGPVTKITNWRNLVVGEATPDFSLQKHK